MKIWTLALISALVLLILNANVRGFSPALSTVLVAQNPYPVEPGGNVNIEVQIQNTGYSGAVNAVVEIIAKDPFKLLPGEDVKKTFANIPGSDFVTTSYNLHVNESAITGDYDIEFRICQGEAPSSCNSDVISINVQGEAELILDSLETVPSKIEPGGMADLIVRVKNIGTGTAKNLNLRLNSTCDELIPVLAKGSDYMGDLAPGQTKTGELRLSVSSAAEDKTYTLILTAEYKNENNTAAEKEFSIGIPVTGSVLLDVITIEPNYNRNILKVEVANKGTSEAKSLEAKFIVEGKVVGIDYISSLKANKKTIFDFPLILQGSGQLVMDYIGPGIEKNQTVEDIVLNFEVPSSGDGTMIFAGVIVVIIIIYFLYRKFLRKKTKKQ